MCKSAGAFSFYESTVSVDSHEKKLKVYMSIYAKNLDVDHNR